MILFRGSYSDAIEPDVHYIALEKDSPTRRKFSKLDDIAYLQGFADRAYETLISSGKYGYSGFAKRLQNIIEEQFPIWIDPAWIELRNEIDRRWSLPNNEDVARGESSEAVRTSDLFERGILS